MALPNNILIRILKSLYADFLESDESIDIGEHHCSLLYPCVSVSKSTSFKPIHTFRLISSDWNKAFTSTANLDRYASHRIVQLQVSNKGHSVLYGLFWKSVILRRYRLFHDLGTEDGTSLIVILLSSN